MTQNLLAYAHLVVRESQRHGGTGWMDYDRVFRQQAAIDINLSWNSIHPGIQAATLVGQASGSPASMCTLCRKPDHTASHCALAYLEPPQGGPVTTVSNKSSVLTRPPSRICYPPRRRPQDQKPICSSWNRGRCIYPSWCSFQHNYLCHLPFHGAHGEGMQGYSSGLRI